MPKRFFLPRVLGLLAAITCTCVTIAVAAQVAPIKQEVAPDSSGIIILDIAAPAPPSGGKKGDTQMPPVVFDHNKHTMGDNPSETCARCHDASKPKTAYTLHGTEGKTGKDLENAFHDSCISCHEDLKVKKMPAGPQKAECRSCHDANKLPAKNTKNTKADGGMDASLHARHIESDLIVAPALSGRVENCAACHHPVDKLSSPGLTADSCRSCHEIPRPGKTKLPAPGEQPASNTLPVSGKRPAFADATHNKCISCHQALIPSGAKAPVTCTACHDASVKADYKKLSPVPRLKSGQPDVVLMGQPPTPDDSTVPVPPPALQGKLPDPVLDASTKPQPAMPPVIFNHKTHEDAAKNCVSCHHNTLQKCSSCHTPQGSVKANNIPLSAVMHMPTSDRSCVGCHETRKKAVPECAGCHAIMPKTKSLQANCASCHTPPMGPAKALPREVAPSALPGSHSPFDLNKRLPEEVGIQPFNPDIQLDKVNQPLMQDGKPITQDTRIAVPKEMVQARINATPETVTIGTLSEEFQPVVFRHREHIAKLWEGIQNSSPGMMTFHLDPYALCASCHHASPPRATPPACVTCHEKGTGNTKKVAPLNGRPLLKAAYHKQCMSCHTAMIVTKPANTDCTSCHVKRVPGK